MKPDGLVRISMNPVDAAKFFAPTYENSKKPRVCDCVYCTSLPRSPARLIINPLPRV